MVIWETLVVSNSSTEIGSQVVVNGTLLWAISDGRHEVAGQVTLQRVANSPSFRLSYKGKETRTDIQVNGYVYLPSDREWDVTQGFVQTTSMGRPRRSFIVKVAFGATSSVSDDTLHNIQCIMPLVPGNAARAKLFFSAMHFAKDRVVDSGNNNI